jgi:hypothetical protein
MSQGITFPENPQDGETFSFTFTHTGGAAGNTPITRTWSWNASRNAWISNGGSGGGNGGNGSPGPTGAQGFQGITGIVGLITAGGVGMFNSPRLSFASPDNSIILSSITGDSGITVQLSGSATPVGPEGSIQFRDGDSLSGIPQATISSSSELLNPFGYSGNFLQYTESISANSNQITTTAEITIPFGEKNIISYKNIALDEGATLTISGFSQTKTGASMTLILGYTGASGSSILISGNPPILWSGGGPIGVTQGQTAYLWPRISPKRYDVLYFFCDGSDIFGNYLGNYNDGGE